MRSGLDLGTGPCSKMAADLTIYLPGREVPIEDILADELELETVRALDDRQRDQLRADCIDLMVDWDVEHGCRMLVGVLNALYCLSRTGDREAAEVFAGREFQDLDVAYPDLIPLDGSVFAMDLAGNALVRQWRRKGVLVEVIDFDTVWRRYMRRHKIDGYTARALMAAMRVQMELARDGA